MSNRRKLRGTRSYGSPMENAPPATLLKFLQRLEEAKATFEWERTQHEATRQAWNRGQSPAAAEVPPWPKDSVGNMFFTCPPMKEVAAAPAVALAVVPSADAIVSSPANWNVATMTLLRAVILDGLSADEPALRSLNDILTPVVRAEVAYGESADLWQLLDFPEECGPLFLVGGYALVDATWAAVADDRLQDVLDVLGPALDGVHHGLAGQAIAEALIGAFAQHYRCERPGDQETLNRIGSAEATGNALENLLAARKVDVEDILRVGLETLSRLAQLCRTRSSSVLGPA